MNPLQCSCLGNPRDGGAWWTAIYGVAQSWTRLKRLSSSSKYIPGSIVDTGNSALKRKQKQKQSEHRKDKSLCFLNLIVWNAKGNRGHLGEPLYYNFSLCRDICDLDLYFGCPWGKKFPEFLIPVGAAVNEELLLPLIRTNRSSSAAESV